MARNGYSPISGRDRTPPLLPGVVCGISATFGNGAVQHVWFPPHFPHQSADLPRCAAHGCIGSTGHPSASQPLTVNRPLSERYDGRSRRAVFCP